MLFMPDDLAGFARDLTVTNDSAVLAERVAWGWLKPVLGLTERPTTVPDEVFSWALELGAIAHENPTGLSSYQLGGERWQFSAERRAEILTEAASHAGGAGGVNPAGPMGSFPDAVALPDPPAVYR